MEGDRQSKTSFPTLAPDTSHTAGAIAPVSEPWEGYQPVERCAALLYLPIPEWKGDALGQLPGADLLYLPDYLGPGYKNH